MQRQGRFAASVEPKMVVFHSANVRSRCVPFGVTMSWHEPHIDESLTSPSSAATYWLLCAELPTGFFTPPRIVVSSASVSELLCGSPVPVTL